MISNLLSLNPSKTEFMLIGLPLQISKISNLSLSLPSDHAMTSTDSARNLGFIFDSSFTFCKQISSLSSACNSINDNGDRWGKIDRYIYIYIYKLNYNNILYSSYQVNVFYCQYLRKFAVACVHNGSNTLSLEKNVFLQSSKISTKLHAIAPLTPHWSAALYIGIWA